MEDKRKFRRVNVDFDVILTAEGDHEITGALRDVAVQGIFVTCDTSVGMGAHVWFRIVLHGGIDNFEVVGKGEVVRVEPGGVGIHFTAIDPECVQHLRNIIAYNADDPAEAWEEMQGGHGLRGARVDD